MISIYLCDKTAYVLDGKASSKRIIINNAYESDAGDDIAVAVTDIIRKINKPKETYSFVVDSMETAILTEKLHCVSQRHLNKTLEKAGIRSGRPVNNQLDAIIDGIESKENSRVETTAKITTIPKSIGLALQKIVTNCEINYEQIEIANTAEAKTIKTLAPKLVKNFVTMNYKSDFVTVSIYSDGEQLESYNIGFMENNDGLAYNRMAELGHRAIIEARQMKDIIVECVYVVGEIVNKEEVLKRLYEELTVKIVELTPLKTIKGLSNAEFDKYFPAIGGLSK